MAVNGILEGYLSIYGWQVYGSLFLLLVAVGLILYPVARLIVDLALAQVEGSTAPEIGARALIAKLTIYVLVLVLGLVPIVPLQVSATNVQNRCGRTALTVLGEATTSVTGEGYGLTSLQDARVPLLPYLAMLLASGFNAILYQATPCLHDLTNLNLAFNTLDFSAAEHPNELKSSVERFERECGATARRLALAMLNGEHGPDLRTYLEGQLAAYATEPDAQRKQLVYPGSTFYQDVFYKPCGGGADPATAQGRLCIMRPLRAENPVAGFPYDPARDHDVSRYQAATGQGLPTCDEWWNDATHGLRAQLRAVGRDVLLAKMAQFDRNCPAAVGMAGGFCTGTFAMPSVENLDDVVVEQMLLAGKRQLSVQTPELGWDSALIAAGLFAFTDVAENIAAQAGSYLLSIYVMKIGASLLQPFVLMTVFMLWGVFLVIGEMRGLILLKGLMLIFVLSILPGLWSFADYIDDQLFLALYPGAPPVSVTNIPAELMSDHSTIERILLTFTTAVFYVIFPLLMLYLVAEAGGPSQGTGMANQGINDPAKGQGGIAGSGVGGARLSNPLKYFKSKKS